MIRIVLPAHLRTLARVDGEVALDVPGPGPVTLRSVLDVLEARYPTLGGTIRQYGSGARRPLLRFFVGGEDWSHESLDQPLPAAVVSGDEPLLVVGAVAGG